MLNDPSLDPAAFLTTARRLAPKLRAWRRHLHAHPELSFAEHETQAYLARALRDLGAEPRPIADTGLLLDIEGGRPGPCVAVRADIDALPIEEVAGRAYGSTVAGVMHACGHDVHATCALGAAALLLARREALPGRVRVIFQPGEELLPGGATRVIAEGGLAAPPVEAIVGLHVAPALPVGSFGVRPGRYMASADELRVAFTGEGGHGALAHRHVDLVACAAQAVVGLQQVVSRKAPPDVPTVLSFGRIASRGGATNVLTDRVELEGTFRTYDENWRDAAHGWIRTIAEHTAEALGAGCAVEIARGYPALSNDPAATSAVRGALGTLAAAAGLGGSVADLALRPTAEDFAWYLREVPGCFFRLGVRNEARGVTAGVHTPEFDVDEGCLPLGAAALAAAACSLLTGR